jgi:outer membrane protein assembly factor BamB
MQSLCMLGFFCMLVACAGVEKPKPAELGPNVALIGVRTAWKVDVGSIDFPVDIRAVGTTVFVANSAGSVLAVDAVNGQLLWRQSLNTQLAAGVGTDGHYVAVISKENELLLLNSSRVLWRAPLGAMTLTAPLIAGGRVFVYSSDRSLRAFDVQSGRRLWLQQRSGDALVLGQSGLLTAVGDTLIVGVGGRVVGVSPLNGNSRWEVPFAVARGTNEVERLVDVVSGASRVGNELCVRAFLSMLGCIDTLDGKLLWAKSSQGASGLTGDASVIVSAESNGTVQAWRRADGEKLWSVESLRYRGLTAPLLLGQSLVVGDAMGLVHWLSRQDGSALNRVATDGSPIASTPVLVGSTLIVATRNGGLFGFKPE